MTHNCCEKLHYYLTEPELSEQIALRYSPHGRSYGISVLDGEHGSAGNSEISISHCPWCGSKLPCQLFDVRTKLLEEMFEDYDGSIDPRTPDEFKTDEWWKKRGL